MKQIHWSGILTATLILFVAASCGSESETIQGDIKVIDLAGAVGKGKIVNISEVADDIKYVALETTENSLIGERARVQIVNGRIYVLSMQSSFSFDIKVFDINGKYLFTFNRKGRGPEEYSQMSSIEIDNVTGGFIAFDLFSILFNSTIESGLFKEYDKDGNYIRSLKLPAIEPGRLESVRKLNENLYISSVGEKSFDPVKIHGAAFDSQSNIVFEIPMASMPDYLPKETIGRRVITKDAEWEKQYHTWPPSIKIFKDVARFIYKHNDTIFTLNQKLNYYPSFVINYGNYRNITDILNIPRTKSDFITIDYSTFVESNRFILIKLNLREYAHEPYDEHIQTKRNDVMTLRRTDCYGMFDKQTGQFNLLNQPVKGKLGIREDINNGPLFFPTDISADDLASTVYSALQLIEHAEVYDVKGNLKELVSKLKDTDNPVVAIAKFK